MVEPQKKSVNGSLPQQGTQGLGFWVQGLEFAGFIIPLEQIEYGFGLIIIRSPYTPYSMNLRGTIGFRV